MPGAALASALAVPALAALLAGLALPEGGLSEESGALRRPAPSRAGAMLDLLGSNGLFAASFQAPTLVQIFFVIHCVWTGVMGALCTFDPSWSPITENGTFIRKAPVTEQPQAELIAHQETFRHPNVRGAWCVRGGSMFIVAAGALFFGTRDTYLIGMASAIWREGYDCTELLLCKKDGHKMVFLPWWSPLGPMPPLGAFLAMNLLAFYFIFVAK